MISQIPFLLLAKPKWVRIALPAAALVLVGCLIIRGCRQEPKDRVVLYCSVDAVYSKPIIAALEKQTGLDIETVYDGESTNVNGLADKIRSEHDLPHADVFWSSTVLQTELLKNEGLLTSYMPDSALDVPVPFKDPLGFWTAVGFRARVMVSTKQKQFHPLSFIPPHLSGRFAIANPQFGTTCDWAAAYGSHWGPTNANDYFQKLQKAGVTVMAGNSDVAVAVANGQMQLGITDSNDFLEQRRQKKPIYLVRTMDDNVLVPGCVSMISGAPHSTNAQKLIEALASEETEAQLVYSMPGLFSVRHLDDPWAWKSGGVDFSYLKAARQDDFGKWRLAWKWMDKPLKRLFSPQVNP